MRALYRQHLTALDGFLADALDRARRAGLGLDGVLFHAGREVLYHADDEATPFHATAHFRRWVPPLEGPDHLVLARPGAPPHVVRVRPQDYWYDTSPPPASHWEEEVTFQEVASFAEGLAALGTLAGVAYVGASPEAAAEAGIPDSLVEPTPLLAPLDWHRATKTAYEVALLRQAAERATKGHGAGRDAFLEGASELEVHWAFLRGSGQDGRDVPFNTIVAFDGKAAILHYQHKRGAEAAPGRVLLLDAGAASCGYAADVTRTWVGSDADPLFGELVAGLDRLQRRLVAMVTPGRPYLEIHLETHRLLAELLSETGLLRASAEEALARGVTRAFMPHGVGHQLGLQVHDVGGHQATAEGGRAEPPGEHPFLRNTRTLEPGHVVTIEPGLYFIGLLLEPLRADPAGALVAWDLVERLAPHGGVRIEDDVLCTDGEPEDLTRPFIGGP